MKGKSWGTILGVVFGVLLSGATTPAAAADRVAVLPLVIYSQEDLVYLQKNVLETLYGNLSRAEDIPGTADGGGTLAEQTDPFRRDELRSAGPDLGADRIVYGSLTKIGQRVTLAGNLMEVKKDQAPQTFSLSEEGLENVLKLVERFSKELSLKISGLEKIADIQVRGAQRIESQAVLREVKSKAGDAYQQEKVDQDLRAIFKMGYFSDVRVETETVPEGRKIVFVVTERPFVKKFEFQGNKELKDEELRDQITLKPFAILNLNAVNDSLEKLKTFYQSKGYYNVQINQSVQTEDNSRSSWSSKSMKGRRSISRPWPFRESRPLRKSS